MSLIPPVTYYTTISDQDGYKLGFSQEDLGEFDWEEDIDIFESTLTAFGTKPVRLGFGQDLVSQLIAIRPPILWNLNSGIVGLTREAQVPTLCEMLGIPLVGPGSWTAFITQDKTLACSWLSKYNLAINVPTSIFIETIKDIGKIETLLFPNKYIVKGNNEDSSRGIDINSVQTDRSGLSDQVEFMLDNWGPVRIEEYIEGFDISANFASKPDIGLIPLCPIKIASPLGIYTGAMKNIVSDAPQKTRMSLFEFDEKLSKKVISLSSQIANVFHFRHYARIDLRYSTDSQKLYFLECNICPSFEPDDDYAFGAELSGLSFSDLLFNILATAYADARNGYHLKDIPKKIRHVFGENYAG